MISLLLFLIYVMVDAIYDKEMIKHEIDVHTDRQYFVRGVLVLCFSLFNTTAPYVWESLVLSVLSYIVLYWFVFDSFFGYIFKKNIFYLSEKGIDGLQLRLMGQPAWFWFKFILALGGAAYIINPSLYQYPY
jgi:hypothetical protein